VLTRRAIILTGFVIVALALAPVGLAIAGGMGVASPRGFTAQPTFGPPSAFGSPGGFPFKGIQDHRGLNPRFPARRVVARHPVFPAFPVTSFLYAPAIPYTLPSEAPSASVSVDPVIYVSPTVYVSVPVAAPAPAPIAAATAFPSTPSVVEYATGRYELRGDGGTTPYTWVWIPNPPTAPPASQPAEVPAATSSPTPRSQVYRWTDTQGTEFFTNRPEKIPEPYRSGAGGQAQLAAQQ